MHNTWKTYIFAKTLTSKHNEYLFFSYFEFKIRLNKLGLSFQKTKILSQDP